MFRKTNSTVPTYIPQFLKIFCIIDRGMYVYFRVVYPVHYAKLVIAAGGQTGNHTFKQQVYIYFI